MNRYHVHTHMLDSNDLPSSTLNGLVNDPETPTCNGLVMAKVMVVCLCVSWG
jgi:hypothetical protein